MRRRTLAGSYLIVGLALVVSYRWLHSMYAYGAIASYGALGAALGTWRMPRAVRTPWLCIAAGLVLWVAGDIEWDAEVLLGRTPGSPSASDGFYLVAYPLVAIGLVLLARGAARTTAGLAIDSAVFGVTLAAALWPLLFSNVIDGGGGSLGERLTMGTYPCWDIVFVVLGARIALSRPLQTRRTLMLLAALAVVFLGDLSWLDAYDVGDWEDYAWLASYIGIAAATLLPAPLPTKEPDEFSSVRRFAVLALPVSIVPAVVLIETLLGHRFTIVDALLMFSLLLLVLMRLWIVVRGLRRRGRSCASRTG